MPTARSLLGVAAINGILYAVGGDQKKTVEAYDPATDTWTTKASLQAARDALGVATVDGILYAVGGCVTQADAGTVEAYDPGNDTWTRKAPLPTERTALAVAAVNGILYAIGGQGSNYTTVEAYHP